MYYLLVVTIALNFYLPLLSASPAEPACPYLETPPSIDALLDDWPAVTPQFLNKNNCLVISPFYPGQNFSGLKDTDLSAYIYSGWDKKNLYIGAKIFDNVVRPSRFSKPLIGNGLNIILNKNPQALVNYYDLLLIPFLEKSQTIEHYLNFRKGDEAGALDNFLGVEKKFRIFEEGYIIEASIPWFNFEGIDFSREPGYLSFILHDYDEKERSKIFYYQDSSLQFRNIKVDFPHLYNKISKNKKTESEGTESRAAWTAGLLGFLCLFLLYWISQTKILDPVNFLKRFLWGFVFCLCLLCFEIVFFQLIRFGHSLWLSRKSDQVTALIREIHLEAQRFKLLTGQPEDYHEPWVHLLNGGGVLLPKMYQDRFVSFKFPAQTPQGIPLLPQVNLPISGLGNIPVGKVCDKLFVFFNLPGDFDPQQTPCRLNLYDADHSHHSIGLDSLASEKNLQIFRTSYSSPYISQRSCLVLMHTLARGPSLIDSISLTGTPLPLPRIEIVGISLARGDQYEIVPLNPVLLYSFSGIPAQLSQDLITQGGFFQTKAKQIVIPVEAETDRLVLFYTSVGYQYPEGSPYGNPIGQFIIRFSDHSQKTIPLLNGINIDSYFMGFLEKHGRNMESRLGFLSSTEGGYKFHVDELEIPFPRKKVKEIIVQDQGSWDAIVLKGIVLSDSLKTSERTRVIQPPSYFRISPQQEVSLKPEILKRLKNALILITQQNTIINSTHEGENKTIGLQLDFSGTTTPLQALKTKKKFGELFYLAQFFPLSTRDFLYQNDVLGWMGILLPLQWWVPYEKMAYAGRLLLLAAATVCLILMLIQIIKRGERVQFKLVLSYLLILLIPLTAFFYFISKRVAEYNEEKINTDIKNNLNIFKYLLEAKGREIENYTSIMIKDPFWAREDPRTQREATIKKMLDSFQERFAPLSRNPQSFFLVEEFVYEKNRQVWQRFIYDNAKNFSHPLSASILPALRQNGLFCNGWGGLYLLGFKKETFKNRTLFLYLYFPLGPPELQALHRQLQRKFVIYHASGFAFHEPALGMNLLSLGPFLEQVNQLRTKANYVNNLPLPPDTKQVRGLSSLNSVEGTSPALAAQLTEAHEYLHLRSRHQKLLYLMFGIVILFIVLTAYQFIATVTDEARSIKKGLEAYQKGDLRHRLNIQSRDEWGKLASTYNQITSQLQERADEMFHLHYLGQQLTGLTDQKELIQAGLQTLLTALTLSRAEIFLSELQGPDYRSFLLFKEGTQLKYRERGGKRLDQPVLQHVHTQGHPLLVDRTSKSLPPAFAEVLAQGFSSLLVLPLQIGNKRLGLVYLSRLAQEPALTPKDLKYGVTLSNLLALAIDNSRIAGLVMDGEYPLLYQHKFFLQHINEAIARAAERKQSFSVILLCLEFTTEVKNSLGRDGLKILRKNFISELLLHSGVGTICARHDNPFQLSARSRAPGTDEPRYNRDEYFEILWMECSVGQAKQRSQALFQTLASWLKQDSRLKVYQAEAFRLYGSLATFPQDGQSSEFLIHAAREILPLSKKSADQFFIHRQDVKSEIQEPFSESLLRTLPAAVFESPAIQQIYKTVNKIKMSDISVLITGEDGTGKDFWAEILHTLSERKNGPYVKVNCATIPENLFESELFGHEKGAFTGAVMARSGKFEQAQGGSIYLDEINSMPLDTQAKLLGVLQDRVIFRLGSSQPTPVNVRVIAATSQDLSLLLKEGKFRKDLFYRLNAVLIHLPPLCERREDLPALIKTLLERYNQKYSKQLKDFSAEILDLFYNHSWPGNIRELDNLLHKIVLQAAEGLQFYNDVGEIKQILKTAAEPEEENLDWNSKRSFLIKYLTVNKDISNAEYCKITGVSSRTAVRDLNRLIEEEVIQRSGRIRGTRYSLAGGAVKS